MGSLADREVPRWLVMSAAAVGLLALVYFGGKILAGHAPDPGPPKRVYPGMYNLRAEAARMRAAQQNQVPAYGR